MRMAALHGAALVSLITFMPIYLRVVHGTSATQTGLLLLPLTAGIGFGSMITGQIVSRTGRTMIVSTIGLAVVTLLLLVQAALARLFQRGRAFRFVGADRAVHGQRDGRCASDGAERGRRRTARRGGRVCAIVAFGRRLLRNRRDRHDPVRLACDH